MMHGRAGVDWVDEKQKFQWGRIATLSKQWEHSCTAVLGGPRGKGGSSAVERGTGGVLDLRAPENPTPYRKTMKIAASCSTH